MSDTRTSKEKSIYENDPAQDPLSQIKARDAVDYLECYTNPWAECAMKDRHWLLREVERLQSGVRFLENANAELGEKLRSAPEPEAVTATEALRARKPLDIALGRLSMAMGNPAVHWNTVDSTLESALVDEATRRLLERPTAPPGAAPNVSTLSRSAPSSQSADVCYCRCDDGDPRACHGWRDEQDEPPCRCICHQPEIPERVIGAVTALCSERVYEDGEMAKGISARFLMRITMLREACGLAAQEQPMVEEARSALTKGGE